jgi:hypothetical protein
MSARAVSITLSTVFKQRLVLIGQRTACGHLAIAVLVDHRQRTAGQIADAVGEIGIDPGGNRFGL